MDVSVESADGLRRRLKVAIPEDRIEGQVTDRVAEMARKVNLPGFRRGKVPAKVVRQRYGKQIRDEIVGEVVRSSLQDAILQENLRPVSSPTIDELSADPGAGVAYQAVFEVYPEVSVPAISELKVERPSAEVADGDVDKMIDTLREQRKNWVDVERAAANDDRLMVDLTGTCDGENFTNGKAEDVPIELGSGRMVAGLEEGLIGVTAEEDRNIEVTFPEDFADEKLAGKAAHFDVHVKTVQVAELPEIDDEFMKGFGVEEGGMDAFRDEIRTNLGRELEEALRNTTKQRVMDALIDSGSLELPDALVEGEVGRITEQRRNELAYQGIDPEMVPFDSAAMEPEARRRVALGLLLGEIVKENEIRPDPDSVRERIETIASTYDESDKVVNYYYSNQERLQEVESAVLEDQVVEWILERAEVADDETTFDDIMNPGQTVAEAGAN
ncbi:MAG: trigger factor [Thiotrichales bacterium]|nr:trigger factor [Thiotrichales bacterium]